MPTEDIKPLMHRYLNTARDAVLWKLEGLSEYDVRRPMVPTGTNLLGIVKHLSAVEIGYFAETFGRPFDGTPQWYGEVDDEPNVDMWAKEHESRDDILGLYAAVRSHADATIEALELASAGTVPWWPEEHQHVTLYHILVHMIAETNRHAGHADVVRELIDGSVGLRADNDNMAPGDGEWWTQYRQRLEQTAQRFRGV